MLKLTEEQYEKLKPYEKDLRNAYKNSFVHMGGADFNVVADIYDQVADKPLSKSQRSCNACRLRALKQLGEAYENHAAETVEKKKTNRGRPRKLDDRGGEVE